MRDRSSRRRRLSRCAWFVISSTWKSRQRAGKTCLITFTVIGMKTRSCNNWLRRPRERPRCLGLYTVVADCWWPTRPEPPTTSSPPEAPAPASGRAPVPALLTAPCRRTSSFGVRFDVARPGDLQLPEFAKVQALVVHTSNASIRADDQLHLGRLGHAAPPEPAPARLRMFRRGRSTRRSPTACSIRVKSLATICRSLTESRSCWGSMPVMTCRA